MSRRRYATIIVGSGAAGLAIACRVGNDDTLILERKKTVGGRVRTVGGEKVDFEAGPWRIHQSHKRVLAFVRKYGLTVRPNSSSRATLRGGALSAYDDLLLRTRDPLEAHRQELATGYEGFLSNARGTEESKTKSGHEYIGQRSGYYVLEEGFQALIDGMRDSALRRGVHLHLDSRVVDVERVVGRSVAPYKVSIIRRDGNRFVSRTYTCDRLILCCPPSRMTSWSIAKGVLRCPLATVGALALHHIYGRLYDTKLKRYVTLGPLYEKRADSLLSQVISGDYESGYFQLSYSGQRRAQFWYRLRLENPRRFKRVLREELEQLLGSDALPTHYRLRDVKSYYWHEAVHRWNPLYGFQNARRTARRCVYPHPIRAPNLYLANEAYSSHQGWVEGALESAAYCLHAMRSNKPHRVRSPNNHEMVLNGRLIDVQKWANIHPGSKAAIVHHLREDVTQLMDHIEHPEYVYGIAFHLQSGYAEESAATL